MPSERPGPVLAFDVYGTLIDPFHMEEHLRAAEHELDLAVQAARAH